MLFLPAAADASAPLYDELFVIIAAAPGCLNTAGTSGGSDGSAQLSHH